MRATVHLVVLLSLAGCHPPPFVGLATDADLDAYADSLGFSRGQPQRLSLTDDGHTLFFLRATPPSKVQHLYEMNLQTGQETRLLTAEEVMRRAATAAEEQAQRARERSAAQGIQRYQLSTDERSLLVPLSGTLYHIDRPTGAVQALGERPGFPVTPTLSPDGRWVATVRAGALYLIDAQGGEERRLSPTEPPGISWGVAEFVAQEEMDRMRGFWWSPDSQHLLVQRTDNRPVQMLWLHDGRQAERAPSEHRYPRAGTANAIVTLFLQSLAGDRVPVQWNHARFPYLAGVRWELDCPALLVVQNRAQTQTQVLRLNAATGQTDVLHTERDPTWLNLDASVPRWLPGTQQFLWSTERNGSWELERRNADGSPDAVIVPAAIGYAGIAHLHTPDHVVVYSRSTPTERHLVQTSLRTLETTTLSSAAGEHRGVWSQGSGVWIHRSDDSNGQRTWTVRGSDDPKPTRISSQAAPPPWSPRVEITTVGEDRVFHAAIVRPRNFSADYQYPVLVYVYGGPGWAVVGAASRRYFLHQWLADHGFVVVMLDGRGTPHRGRSWERAIHRNLSRIALADQEAGLRALGARYPELDLSRVGVLGWSFGGYLATMAVLRRPEVYRAAFAGAPVSNWNDYDTHYTERYMGLPSANHEGYEDTSLLTWARFLERPLLLAYGTADDNVYPMHSLKLSSALFRAGRDHELLPLSGFAHHVHGRDAVRPLWGRVIRFFSRHLGVPR